MKRQQANEVIRDFMPKAKRVTWNKLELLEKVWKTYSIDGGFIRNQNGSWVALMSFFDSEGDDHQVDGEHDEDVTWALTKGTADILIYMQKEKFIKASWEK